jgi:FdhE protein
VTRDVWLAAHPYLQPVADLDALVSAAAADIDIPVAAIPDWDAYADDFHAGVSLLHSPNAGVDLSVPEDAVLALIEKVAASPLPFPPTDSGLTRYLGWVVLAQYLSPVVGAFGTWRNEEHWLRNYCPTCGEPPAMGQLIGKDPGRLRKLSCGRCKTRWRYRRTGCPFCDAQDEHRLAVVAVEGEGGLRLDYCETCGGYLKTYDGEGNESVLLADWTSLHLDLVARERGLKRLAASLFAF